MNEFARKVDDLAEEIVTAADGKARFIVALAGPPAAGKSTLSELLDRAINRKAGAGTSVVVPMDGYHLDNRILNARGLLPRKGAPQTFDTLGFVSLVERLRENADEVVYPVFDRTRDIAIAGAGVVAVQTPIIIVEGNYLLCRDTPWDRLMPLFDKTVFVTAPLDELERRLIKRWLDHGLEPDAAKARALSNDIPNARFVVETAAEAGVTFQSVA